MSQCGVDCAEARVMAVEPLNGHSFRVRLRIQQPWMFQPGQYVNLRLAERAVPYSVASSPEALPELELHIFDQGDGSLSRAVLDHLRSREQVILDGPMGECVLRPEMLDQRGPLILIAAGSGFAQMKSLVESALARRCRRPIHLYWGVRHSDQLYGRELIAAWEQAHAGFRFVPVVEDDARWDGRRGLVHQAVLEDFADFADAEVFVCGSPAMVYAVEDDLLPRGLRQGHIHSDVFSYAPRAASSAS